MGKKFNALLITFIVLTMSIFTIGCGGSSKNESPKETKNSEPIKIAALKGPTALGALKLLKDDKKEYDISIYDSPDQLIGKIVNGEVDGAMVPSNMASILYNKTKGKVEFVAINTLGVLYIVENGDTIKSIKDLKGKTLYATGKGAVPEYALNYILNKNGLNPEKDLTIDYKMSHQDLATAIASKEVNLAMLPQPFVTIVQSKDKDLNIPINLTEEWDKVSNGESKLVMGTLIFRKDFIENRKNDLHTFLKKYEESINFVNNNLEETGQIAEENGIIPNAKIAEKAIPKCNIVFIDGKEGKEAMEGFLKVLEESNPKSIGGALPNEDFYYEGK
ncbi:ABC transporter substrate-binding protein [Clostridium fallax]|uniref:NitT/TauT family transport system substrate-binding protein n=1 Tax=Clostridium fallax TaxID=1533 RepID=A0A1M4SXU4_9CLOT|nr:NitT/TauT family transport system substrate-binding protein [Clostridium fallax]SQB08021.1 putative lipoprotein [Clostridium fallax]